MRAFRFHIHEHTMVVIAANSVAARAALKVHFKAQADTAVLDNSEGFPVREGLVLTCSPMIAR